MKVDQSLLNDLKGSGERPISSSKCTMQSFISLPLHSKQENLTSQQREIET